MNAHSHQPQRLKQALNNVRRALEELESAMVEFEEEFSGRSSVRPQERRGLDLLSIPEVCQELGMGKSWLYRKLRSGEIPSVKLGRNIKVKRSSLEEYLENQTVQQAQALTGQLTDQARGAVGQVVGQVGQVAQGEQRIMGRAVDVGRAAEGLAGTAEEEPDVTKAARRKAEALGVDLSKVQGSGIGGCITIKDVVGAAS
jgi:excisionase family DNA binding protein